MKYILTIFVSIIGLLLQTANADLNLDIVGGVDASRKIAVVPFSGQNLISVNYSDLISRDLAYSGMFLPISPNSIKSRPSKIQEINASEFSTDTEAVVVGFIEKSPTKLDYLNIRVELGLLSGGKVLPLKVINGEVPIAKLRFFAHNVSDFIFEQLTNIKGSFSTKIAYVRTKFGTKHPYELCIADFDGHNEQRLLISSQPLMSPNWSSDGKSIVYVSFEHRKAEIYSIDIKTKQRKLLTSFKGLNSNPKWSPDGSRIAMVLSKDGNPEIYVLNILNKTIKRITNNSAIDTEPSWSSDGNTLYFVSERMGKAQVFSVNMSNGNIQRVTTEPTKNLSPIVLQNGQGIVMINQGEKGFSVARKDFNGGFYILTSGRLDESPTLSSNGTMILYSSVVAGKKVLSLVSTNGRFKKSFDLGSGEISSPSWSTKY